MTTSRSRRSSIAVLAFAAAACISSSPPAPPARWFDPLPAAASGEEAASGSDANVQVVAAPYLGTDFAVRVGERELAFDGENRWLADPQRIVATVLARALRGRSRPGGAPFVAALDLFELDVTAEPRAHVRLRLLGDTAGAADRVIDVWAPSADRSPASFAAAMAKALADVGAAARASS